MGLSARSTRAIGETVFPPRSSGAKQRQPREEGDLKKVKMIGFRPPPELLSFITEAEAAGYTKTAVVLRCVEIAKDVIDAMGDDWWEVERRANVEKVGPGVVLSRLALEALKKPGRK